MSIKSPITGKPNVKLLERIAVEDIVRLYNCEVKVNVRRFFKSMDYVFIYKCLDTDFLFYYPFTVCGDENFYDELKVKHNRYYSQWKWDYEIAKDFISTNDKVYEIGAGNGFFLKYLKENGISNVSGSELNHDSVEQAIKKGIDLEFKTIEKKATEVENEFDIICTFQVLEHVADVKSFLESCIHLLKSNGKLLLSVPYNSPFLFRYDKYHTLNMPPHHMGLWNQNSFKYLPNHFDLRIEKIIIEPLPSSGYDFDRFYHINKEKLYPNDRRFKGVFDWLYYRWLKKFHSNYPGKNIFVAFRKS